MVSWWSVPRNTEVNFPNHIEVPRTRLPLLTLLIASELLLNQRTPAQEKNARNEPRLRFIPSRAVRRRPAVVGKNSGGRADGERASGDLIRRGFLVVRLATFRDGAGRV